MIQYVDTGAGEYRPGVCNIGPAEIRRRRQIGYLGLAAAVAVAAALLALDAPAWTRLIIALPVAGALSGFIQAQQRFCAGFAMSGLQNMGEQVRVEDAAARAADRRKAILIHGASIAGGLAAGIAFALLPI
jgi:hypothetical protein